jgi:hypothetical protein
MSSLASGRGGPRYCGGQQSGLKKRLSSPNSSEGVTTYDLLAQSNAHRLCATTHAGNTAVYEKGNAHTHIDVWKSLIFLQASRQKNKKKEGSG